jgi:hypothetical protein
MIECIAQLAEPEEEECRDVGGGREVEAAEAAAAAQQLEIDRTGAGVPGGEVDPALGLLGPFVQVHAPEGVLGARQRDRLLGFARQVVRLDREPKVRIGFAFIMALLVKRNRRCLCRQRKVRRQPSGKGDTALSRGRAAGVT